MSNKFENYHYINSRGSAFPSMALTEAQLIKLRKTRDTNIEDQHNDVLIIRECFKCEPHTIQTSSHLSSRHDLHCLRCGRNFYRGDDLTDYTDFKQPVDIVIDEDEDEELIEQQIVEETVTVLSNQLHDNAVIRVDDRAVVETYATMAPAGVLVLLSIVSSLIAFAYYSGLFDYILGLIT